MVAVKQGQVRLCGWMISVGFDEVKLEKTPREVKVNRFKSHLSKSVKVLQSKCTVKRKICSAIYTFVFYIIGLSLSQNIQDSTPMSNLGFIATQTRLFIQLFCIFF